MKLNPEKCILLVYGHKHECILLVCGHKHECILPVCGHKRECILTNIGGTLVIEYQQEKLLRISIDRDLAFGNHIKGLCKNEGRKLNAISRQCKILPFYRRKTLLNTFFDSAFAFYPLVWMFHGRQINTKNNNIQCVPKNVSTL